MRFCLLVVFWNVFFWQLLSADDGTLFIREFRVQGARSLPTVDIEKTVYPFLGPGRTTADVEAARQALEQRYHSEGLQTVMVEVPPQQVRRGVVVLRVREVEVGRLRVRGSRYFDIEQVKRDAPSVAEGQVPNFNHVMRDVVALNQMPDRRVTPELKPGIVPDTVDIDLVVEDSLPLHGSLEVNNRYSSGTRELRLNGALRYDNILQAGHSLGVSFQVAPQDLDEVFVVSGFYNIRFRNYSNWRLMLQGTKQDTNISTLGGITVAGSGDTVGFRFMYSPAPSGGDFQSLSFGMDYKKFNQDLDFGEDQTASTPITYYPVSLLYSLIMPDQKGVTELYLGLNFHFRTMGSDAATWSDNRYKADGNYVTLRGELARAHDIGGGFQFYGKMQGQLASGPLISHQQFAAGGLDTVRGYLEGEVIGDQALLGSLEMRGPAYANEGCVISQLRLHAFIDAGILGLRQPLPEQKSSFRVSSLGFGTRFQLYRNFSGSIDFAVPLWSQSSSDAGTPRITFVLRGEL
jgi:hemolysin activation/secretion protein